MTAREIADLFDQLEIHLIRSLRRNLTRHKRQEQDEGGVGGVPEHWEAWQAAKLRDIRRFRRENRQILGQFQEDIHRETAAMLREQYAEGGSDGFFHTADDRLLSLIEQMQGNEHRAERAALRYMDDVYRRTILRTAAAMTAGGMTLQQATDEATKDFLEQGINCVRYSNGRQVNIASYAEMALRTCTTRAMLLGEGRQRSRMGINTVLVSQYGACSDTCLPWQGKVYVDDVFQEYTGPTGGSFAVSLQGRQYLRLSVAIRAGLFHPNCRHTITTWIEGVSRIPEPMDPAQIEKVSRLEQRQRTMERAVRKAKRLAAGLTDPEAVKEAKRQVRLRQSELREFVAEHGDALRRDYWRERDTGGNAPAKDNGSLATTSDSPDRLEFVAAESGKEAKAFALNVLGISPEAPYEIDVNVEVANAVNEAVYRISSEFGSLSEYGYLDGIAVLDHNQGPYAMYSRSKRVVALNRAVVKENALEELAQDALFQYEQGGWSSPNPLHSIYHELGHAVQHMYLDNHPALQEKIEVLYKQTYRDILGENTVWTMETEAAGSYGRRAKAAGFSYYGLRNASDFVAEAIAQYYCMNNPGTITFDVINLLLKG